MPTPSWPVNIDIPDFPLEETSNRTTIRSPFEAGYVQTRPKHTRARRRFKLHWSFLPTAQANTLQTFFETIAKGGGVAFTWTHPLTGTVYTVRFSSDEFKPKLIYAGMYELETEIEEV